MHLVCRARLRVHALVGNGLRLAGRPLLVRHLDAAVRPRLPDWVYALALVASAAVCFGLFAFSVHMAFNNFLAVLVNA